MDVWQGPLALVGLGNILLGDEGFGVHFIRHLKQEFCFPEGVDLIDGGCAGLGLLNLIRDYKTVILFDVLLKKAPPGTIYVLEMDALENLPSSSLASAHQIGVKDALALARFSSVGPEKLWAYAVVPKDLSPGVGLSAELREAFFPLQKRLFTDLKTLGIYPEKGGSYVSRGTHEID